MSQEATVKTQAPPASVSPLRRWFPIAFTLVIGVSLSLVVFAVMDHLERERLRVDFERKARDQEEAIAAAMAAYAECLYTLRNLFASSNSVSHQDFQFVADDLRERHAGIQLLQWLPRVRHTDRASLEIYASEELGNPWRINQGYRGSNGAIQPVEPRTEYLPILYIAPTAGNEVALGFDHFRGPHQAVVHRSIESGQITATRRINLRDLSNRERGWVLFLPVFDTGPPPQTPDERRARLKGFVEGAFRLSDLVVKNLTKISEGMQLIITDETPDTSEPYILNVDRGEWQPAPPPRPSEFTGTFVDRRIVSFAGRQWMLHTRPTPEWLASKRTGLPYVVLVFGIWLTAVLATSLHNSRRRADTITRLVDTRTVQLRRVQDQLREDIRRRKQAEERYRAFVEQSTEAIWRFELTEPMPLIWPHERQLDFLLKQAYMAECNDACARMYGYEKAKDMIGKRLGEIMPIDDPVNVEHLTDYIRCGFRMVNSESHELDRHGRVHIFLNNIVGIMEDGSLVRSWGTQRDITEQRRTEGARIANEQRLRVALAAANLGLWEWDRRTDSVTWNEELHRMFLLPPGELKGTYESFLASVHPEDRGRVSQVFDAALRYNHEFETECRIFRTDEAERWIYLRGDVREEQSRIFGMVGAAIDITARKLAEEERSQMDHRLQETQKLESLGILAGGIAHDFNNLLTGILGNASLARMDLSASSPVQQSLTQIEQAAQRAADLCKQMLAYSGKGRFVVQLLNLSQLVEEAVPLLNVSISKHSILKLRLSEKLPSVSADATQLRQILMNLVINASDALGERGGVIEVSTDVMHADAAYLGATHLSPILPEGNYVCLEVSDNGSGMSLETQQKIFDPFFTTKFTGRGLGLAAVLGIVRGHRGALKVYSEPGKGTTFKLLLPQAEGAAESLRSDVETPKNWRSSGLALVIDDEETVRNVASRMLRIFGFDVLTATDGHQGLDIFREHQDEIRIVLLDLTMPQLDGAQTFSELRRIRANVRVLLMSGFNEQHAINRFAGKGLAGFIQKPFKAETLGSKLRVIVEAQPEDAPASPMAPTDIA